LPARKLLVSAAILAVMLAGAVLLMRSIQGRLAFPAPPAEAQMPGALDAAGGEAVWLDVDGHRVEAWFLPARRAGRTPLILNTHGNGELIDQWAAKIAPLRDAGIGVLLVEYPGYGRSGGSPSEKSITSTMLAAYDWAVKDPRVDAARIVAHGRSMGGGAAGQLLKHRRVAALILESTYTSLADMVTAHGVPDMLVLNRLDTIAALRDYAGPVLVLHGATDGAIPVAHAWALAQASPRSRLEIRACGHNDCPLPWEVVLGFLAENGVFTAAVLGDRS
jgi:fermentation-respiration switch protein FrsA (DUF1100 family)